MLSSASTAFARTRESCTVEKRRYGALWLMARWNSPFASGMVIRAMTFPPPMLYLLLTGSHYLDFSLEREEMMRQIAEDPMAPFATRGLDAWPEMEEVLAKALSKDPAKRYPSMRAFSDAWRAAAGSRAVEDKPRKSKAAYAQEAALRDTRTMLMQRIGFGGPLLSGGRRRRL